MASARSTAIPAREQGRRFVRTSVAFEVYHQQYLHLYVATYEAMANAKQVTPASDPTDVRQSDCQCTLATHEPSLQHHSEWFQLQ